MPVNLFPLTWLLPSGNLFIQAEFQAEIFDYKNMIEYKIADIPHSVRVYPASGGTAVFPMTPQNNWTATIIFCGGTNLNADQWTTTWPIAAYAADNSCVRISPDVDLTWYDDDPLETGRSMGQVGGVDTLTRNTTDAYLSSSTCPTAACSSSTVPEQVLQATETTRECESARPTDQRRNGGLISDQLGDRPVLRRQPAIPSMVL